MRQGHKAHQGPKPVACAENGMVSTSHPLVTTVMIDVLRAGGNAVDAAITGSILGPVVEPHMTTHSGTVSFLYWDAERGKAYYLDSSPILPSGLKPFCPHPFAPDTAAAIPGSIPGLKEMMERFGTMSWSEYLTPAIKSAEEGHTVTSWEYALLYGGYSGQSSLLGRTYFPSGRAHFAPNGFQIPAGENWKRPKLAETLKKSAEEGPEYFIDGAWAKKLVEKGNQLGWDITIDDIASYEPLWLDPIKRRYGLDEIISIPPPQRGGYYTGFTLGVLEAFNLKEMGHYTESAETLSLIAWTLRRAHMERELIHDIHYYDVPLDDLLSAEYLETIANLWKGSRPKRDLSGFLDKIYSESFHLATLPGRTREVSDSCELSVVDMHGNWVQMMETGGGGIPGVVVDGVPGSGIKWERYAVSEPGGRTQHAIANTLIAREGKPWMALGSPGDCIFTVPQVLLNILEFDMDIYDAIDAPRFWPLRDDYSIEAECRIPEDVVNDLKKRGILLRPLGFYHWSMGSMQVTWWDKDREIYGGVADPRRLGIAEGY